MAACATLCLTVLGCSDPEPPPPEVLSVSAAGGAYLDAVCPVNAAWDAADLELDRLRLAAGRGGERLDARPLAEALRGVATASERAAEELDAASRRWPAGTEAAVESVLASLQDDAAQARRVAKLDADELLGYAWQDADVTGEAAAAARAALGLPEDPEAACAEREESGGAGGAGEAGGEAGGADDAGPAAGDPEPGNSGNAGAPEQAP
ncbi:hypothetical protein B4915_08135 [Leucobacter massiliensis]|uniref:Uncharacterized protein n=2 Tax=Leucobacter massiliensis TaxID=1686285 RepID=A0A2S9QMM8_9MICO|nr:hypothetical protein B4915_08135 [Leucobacter massiliensis]